MMESNSIKQELDDDDDEYYGRMPSEVQGTYLSGEENTNFQLSDLIKHEPIETESDRKTSNHFQATDLSSQENLALNPFVCKVEGDGSSSMACPSTMEEEPLFIQSSVDHLVSGYNEDIEVDIAGRPLYEDSSSFELEVNSGDVYASDIYAMAQGYEKWTRRCTGLRGLDAEREGNSSYSSNIAYNSSCHACKLSFTSDAQFRSHMVEQHIESWVALQEDTGDLLHPNPLEKCTKSEFEYFDEHEQSFSQNDINNHTRKSPTLEKALTCSECGKGFNSNSHLIIHMRKHTGEKPFKCTKCTKSFSQSSSLKAHLKVHATERPYKCNYCNIGYFQKGSYDNHMRIHTEDEPSITSSEWIKQFWERQALFQHMTVQEKPFKCSKCYSRFKSNENLQKHLVTSHLRYKCDICGVWCGRREILRKHRRMHGKGKMNECSECGKSFPYYINLSNHMRLHAKQRPFRCDKCPNGYWEAPALDKHLKTHEKPFKCEKCRRGFENTEKLQAHMVSHMKVKPYQCDLCDVSFIHPKDLTRHKNAHTKEVSCECVLCGKGYAYTIGLMSHFKTHIKKKPMKCTKCSRNFMSGRLFYKHLIKHVYFKLKSNNCSEKPTCTQDETHKELTIQRSKVHENLTSDNRNVV